MQKDGHSFEKSTSFSGNKSFNIGNLLGLPSRATTRVTGTATNVNSTSSTSVVSAASSYVPSTVTGYTSTISHRHCAVYGTGLSRVSMHVLARRHNQINQVQRVTTFPEIATSCWSLLFVHFAKDSHRDQSNMPDVPHYNTKAYGEFKQEFSQYLVSSRVVCVGVLLKILFMILSCCIFVLEQSLSMWKQPFEWHCNHLKVMTRWTSLGAIRNPSVERSAKAKAGWCHKAKKNVGRI